MPTTEFPSSESLLKGIDFGGPGFELARARAELLLEKATLNEAMKVIDELAEEVRTMQISDRFLSGDRVSRPTGENTEGLSFAARGLDEKEKKREQILHTLERLRTEISTIVSGLRNVVMDIEATKVD